MKGIVESINEGFSTKTLFSKLIDALTKQCRGAKIIDDNRGPFKFNVRFEGIDFKDLTDFVKKEPKCKQVLDEKDMVEFSIRNWGIKDPLPGEYGLIAFIKYYKDSGEVEVLV